jgi:D-glycero-alpha-D-manno-heptose 1-phosphate guanylyltransferase
MQKLIEAIILAGGLGTRLRSMVDDRPKAMALVNDKPFLTYLLDYWIGQGINRFVLSVGYKAEMIQDYFGSNYNGAEIVYALENEPLGTGGAVKNALPFVQNEHILVTNGDSMFRVDAQEMFRFHLSKSAEISFALKEMQDFDRYGIVSLDENRQITGFQEKRFTQQGLINAGVYILQKSVLDHVKEKQFSLEKDVFEQQLSALSMFGFQSEGYFMDIGIPEDYTQIQTDALFFDAKYLFLDRDGVINQKIDGDYVREVRQFAFLPNVLNNIVASSKIFERIVVVTNQQGIGKGLMSASAVDEIHKHLITAVEESGGRIDAIYVAPQLAAENSAMRKPNIGMALLAKEQFPEIDFSKSLMIGDSQSDALFAQNAGMRFLKVESKTGFGKIRIPQG